MTVFVVEGGGRCSHDGLDNAVGGRPFLVWMEVP